MGRGGFGALSAIPNRQNAECSLALLQPKDKSRVSQTLCIAKSATRTRCKGLVRNLVIRRWRTPTRSWSALPFHRTGGRTGKQRHTAVFARADSRRIFFGSISLEGSRAEVQ